MKSNNFNSGEGNTDNKSTNMPQQPSKKFSALRAAGQARPATERVKPSAKRDIGGTGGMQNDGTSVSYEEQQ